MYNGKIQIQLKDLKLLKGNEAIIEYEDFLEVFKALRKNHSLEDLLQEETEQDIINCLPDSFQEKIRIETLEHYKYSYGFGEKIDKI